MTEDQAIAITVKTQYIKEQSAPSDERFVYAYNINITNNGTTPAQLISRYWHITDAMNRIQEVQGEGVVGEQPLIQPGESYNYTSGVVLNTQTGIMMGHYAMRLETGEQFKAEIPPFILAGPQSLH